MELVDAIARGEAVQTAFGEFRLRSFRRYEGRNPRTGEAVIVPAKHLMLCLASTRFRRDVLKSSDGVVAPPGAKFGDDYVSIVQQLRKKQVTIVPEWDAWAETEPKDPVAFQDLGSFAVFVGPDHDTGKRRTHLAFLQSEAVTARLRATLGE